MSPKDAKAKVVKAAVRVSLGSVFFIFGCSDLQDREQVKSPNGNIVLETKAGKCGAVCSPRYQVVFNDNERKIEIFDGRGAALNRVSWLSGTEIIIEFCEGRKYKSLGEIHQVTDVSKKPISITVITKRKFQYRDMAFCDY